MARDHGEKNRFTRRKSDWGARDKGDGGGEYDDDDDIKIMK